MFENRVQRRIFGLKRVEVTDVWRRLYKDAHHNLYSLSNLIRIKISRRVRWAGHVDQRGKRNAYRIFMGNPEGKRPLGRPRRRVHL
jgi:hypothetical protein